MTHVRFFCNTLLNVLSRLAEAEFNLSQLNSRLEEERSRREAAEEAMRLTEQRVVRYKRKYIFFFYSEYVSRDRWLNC